MTSKESLYARGYRPELMIVHCSVPDSDLLRYLPELLDGLFGMIADPNRELRQAVHKALQVPPCIRASSSVNLHSLP